MMSNKNNKNIPKLRFSEFINSWEDKKLNEILNYEPREINKPEKTFLSIGIRSHFKGTFQKPNFDPNTIEMDKLFIVKINDLVVNITFAWEGAVAIAGKEDDDGLVSHRFPTFTFKDNIVTSKFFRYLYPTKRFLYELGLASPGGAGRNRVLSKKDFLEIEFKIPDIEEQQKIAEFLNAVDERIDLMKKKLVLLKKYKKGVMQKIFSQEMRFKDEYGKSFPEWEKVKFGDVARFSKGFGISKEDTTEDGKTEVIRYGELYTTYNEIILNIKSKTMIDPSRLVLSKMNDVIIPSSGETHIDIATASCVMKEGVALGGDINIIRSKNNGIFMSYYLNNAKKYDIARLAQGVSVIHLYNENIKELDLLLPNLEEQQKIANFLSSIDDIIQHQERKLEEAKKFKKSLLQQMFV